MSNTGIFCSACGQFLRADATFCSKCGARQTPTNSANPAPGFQAAAPAPAMAQNPPTPSTWPQASAPVQPQAPIYQSPQSYVQQPSQPGQYGGFWLRVLATIIDGAVTGVVTTPLAFILMAAVGLSSAGGGEPNPEAMIGAFVILMPFFIGIPWLYAAFMESSKYQATLGKLALGMKVTALDGSRISFGRATGRYFGKVISGIIIYIGFLMVAFTERKQGLHDMMAGTLVVKK